MSEAHVVLAHLFLVLVLSTPVIRFIWRVSTDHVNVTLTDLLKEEPDMIIRTGTCMLCGKPGQFEVADEKLAKRILAWLRLPVARRPFVQREFPELPAGLREQLMNGTHEPCFDKAFPEEEE